VARDASSDPRGRLKIAKKLSNLRGPLHPVPIKIDSNSLEAYYGRDLTYFNSGLYEAAIFDFTLVIDVNHGSGCGVTIIGEWPISGKNRTYWLVQTLKKPSALPYSRKTLFCLTQFPRRWKRCRSYSIGA